MKRKTYTSCEVKNRWNAEHYDRAIINLPKGGADELRAIAAAKGMTMSGYIRHLIISDNRESPELTENIRGGGVVDNWRRMQREALEKLGIV